MHRNRPSQADPERGFRVFQNKSGQTLVRGDSAYYLAANDPGAGTTPNGVMVGLPSAPARVITLWAGICFDDSIQEGAWGRFQVSGYCEAALVSPDPGIDIAIGDPLMGDTSTTHLISVLIASGLSVFLSKVTAMALIPQGGAPALYPVMLSGS